MKKILMTMMLAISTICAMAGDYDYLVLVSESDGTATASSIESSGLTITFSNGNIVLTGTDGAAKTLPMSQLVMMYFSDTAEGGVIETPTLIQEALNDMEESTVEVYKADGSYCGTFSNLSAAKAQLKSGIYLMKNNDKTVKIAVK